MNRWVIERAAEITKAAFTSSVSSEKLYEGSGSEMGAEVGAFLTAIAKAIENAERAE